MVAGTITISTTESAIIVLRAFRGAIVTKGTGGTLLGKENVNVNYVLCNANLVCLLIIFIISLNPKKIKKQNKTKHVETFSFKH